MATRPSNSVVPSLFRADWSSGVSLERAYSTNVTSTKGQVERRVGLLAKPYIECTADFKALEAEQFDSTRLMALLEQVAGSRPLIPVWCEFFTLTQDANVGASTLVVRDTVGRLIRGGSEVLICYPENKTRWRYETATIASILGTQVFLTTGTSNAYPSGARIFLSMRSEARLDASGLLVTRRTGSATLSFREVHDPGVILPTVDIGSTLAGSSFNGIPILSVFYDWADGLEVGRMVDGTSEPVGLDNVTEINGTLSRLKATLTFKALNRTDANKVRNFFDHCGGRLLPFWLPWPSEDFDVLSLTTTNAVVSFKGLDPTYLAAQVGRHMAFVGRDGSIAVARIASVTVGSQSANIAFSSAILVPASLRRASWCSLVRFDSDSMKEKWSVDDQMTAAMSVIGLKVSGDGEDTGSPPTIDPPPATDPLDPWNPFNGCPDGAPVPAQPLYESDCYSLDFDRPLFRVSDLVVPKKLALSFGSDWTRNGAVPGPSLDKLIHALISRREWILEYDSSSYSASRHWHHLRHRNGFGGGFWNWDDSLIGIGGAGTEPNVDRHIFKTTAEYQDAGLVTRTLEIRVHFETSDDLTRGGWGCFCHIYVFTDELPAYVDGTPYDQGGDWTTAVSFTKDDPAVFEYTDYTRRCHPQLAICASVPTCMESACGFTRNRVGTVITDTPQPIVGLPWLGSPTDGNYADDNSVLGKAPTCAAYMLGGSVDGSRLMEYVCIYSDLAALNADRPGFDEAGASLTFSSSMSLRACGPVGSPVPECTGHPSAFNPGSVRALGFTTPDACCFKLEDFRLGLTPVMSRSQSCDSGYSESTCAGMKAKNSLIMKPFFACWNEGVPGYSNSQTLEVRWALDDNTYVRYEGTLSSTGGWTGIVDSVRQPGSPFFSWTEILTGCSESVSIAYISTFQQFDYDYGGPPYYMPNKYLRPVGSLPLPPDPGYMVDPACGAWIGVQGIPPLSSEATRTGFCGNWVVYNWSDLVVP